MISKARKSCCRRRRRRRSPPRARGRRPTLHKLPQLNLRPPPPHEGGVPPLPPPLGLCCAAPRHTAPYSPAPHSAAPHSKAKFPTHRRLEELLGSLLGRDGLNSFRIGRLAVRPVCYLACPVPSCSVVWSVLSCSASLVQPAGMSCPSFSPFLLVGGSSKMAHSDR